MEQRTGAGDAGAPDDRPVAVLAALAANVGIAIAKFVAAVVTGSSAMLAEGIHSVADTGDQLLLLLGRRRARRPADDVHPFGNGAEAYFAAFLVAVVLFALGSLFSIVEGVQKLLDPHPIESPVWAIGVLVVAMVLEGASLRTALRSTRRERRGRLLSYVRETRRPEAAIVILEDGAAEMGLVAALAGITGTIVTGDGRYDAAGTLAIGALLAAVAVFLAREMRSLLVGEAAGPRVLSSLREVIGADGDVDELVDLRTMHLGPEDLLVTVRVRLDGERSAEEAVAAVDRLRDDLERVVPVRAQVCVEPVR